MERALKLAKIFAVTPMVSGVTIFVVWYFTRLDQLMLAGVFVIYGGLIFVSISALFVLQYVYLANKNKTTNWKRPAIKTLSLACLNFPAAAAILWLSLYLMSSYTVQIRNESSSKPSRIEILDPLNNIYSFGTVDAFSTERKTFHFSGEGSVKYNLTINSRINSGVLFGYITSGPISSSANIVISKAGKVSVQEYASR